MSATKSLTQDTLLVDRELNALLGSAIRSGWADRPVRPEQISPASIDLRLGARGWRMRAGFLPGRAPIERTIADLALSEFRLDSGAVFERGVAYLVELEEELFLEPHLRGRFNPRSSTGRCDIFTRVLCDHHPRFDETPAGYRGKLWIEIAPLSFPVRLARGDRLAQLRLSSGNPALNQAQMRALYQRTPLVHDGERPIPLEEARIGEDGTLELCVGLAGRNPCGWRSATHTDLVEFAREGAHAALDFWEPLRSQDGRCILAPESFYIFASRERLIIPPDVAAEMLPIDVGIGELRNNYAGFFDNGFGCGADGRGTPAVLEVRAHDVPFLVEDGQPFCRLRFFRTSERPARLYGEGRPSYQGQDLTLARCFRTTT